MARVSFSQYSMWSSCPQQYKLSYIDKLYWYSTNNLSLTLNLKDSIKFRGLHQKLLHQRLYTLCTKMINLLFNFLDPILSTFQWHSKIFPYFILITRVHTFHLKSLLLINYYQKIRWIKFKYVFMIFYRKYN